MPSEFPLVSVIVPNLHSPVLRRTLESLSAQDYPGEWEIILVGQDRHKQVFEHPRLRSIVTPQPVIQSIARNIGIQEARGEILAFTDSDCVARPDWLRRHVAHYADPQVQVVGGGVSFHEDNYWTLCDNLATFHEYLASTPPGPRQQLASLNLSVRRSALDVVGGFDETLAIAEDVDLTTRLRLQGFPLLFDPQALITHLPPRTELKSILRHAYRFGQHSKKLDPRYRDLLETAWPLRHWWATLLFAPLLAGGVTARILFQKNLPRRYWKTLPVIYLTKLVWCLGAARTLWRTKQN